MERTEEGVELHRKNGASLLLHDSLNEVLLHNSLINEGIRNGNYNDFEDQKDAYSTTVPTADTAASWRQKALGSTLASKCIDPARRFSFRRISDRLLCVRAEKGDTPLTDSQRTLAAVAIINFCYVGLQLAVGSSTGSLAMLSDAFHNLSDVVAALVAFKCDRMRETLAPKRNPNTRRKEVEEPGTRVSQRGSSLLQRVQKIALRLPETKAGMLSKRGGRFQTIESDLRNSDTDESDSEHESDGANTARAKYGPFSQYRFQVLGSFVNATCLISLSGYLVLSALPLLILRNPDTADEPFDSSPMFVAVAASGVALNVASALLMCCGGRNATSGRPIFQHVHLGCDCSEASVPSNFGSSPASTPTTLATDAEKGETFSFEIGIAQNNRVSYSADSGSCNESCCSSPAIISFDSLREYTANDSEVGLAAARPSYTAPLDLAPNHDDDRTAEDLKAALNTPFGFVGKGRQKRRVLGNNKISSDNLTNASTMEQKTDSHKTAEPSFSEYLKVQSSPSTTPPTPIPMPTPLPPPPPSRRHGNFAIDANMWTVLVHSLSDAASSLAVTIVGLIVLLADNHSHKASSPSSVSNHSRHQWWVMYLDPAVTIVLAVFMALSVRSVFIRCWNVLLEMPSLSPKELSRLRRSLSRIALETLAETTGKHITRGGKLKYVEGEESGWKWECTIPALVITDIDLTNRNRRASVALRLRRIPLNGLCNGSTEEERGNVHRTTGAADDANSSINMNEESRYLLVKSRVREHMNQVAGVRWAAIELHF